jgi:FixJ family two-component response regulator
VPVPAREGAEAHRSSSSMKAHRRELTGRATRRATREASEGTVYLVDDDEAMLGALSRLMRSAGLESRTFSSAQAFLKEPLDDAPCCLVLDLSLPGPSGLDLQETLGRRGLEIPIIFITGHGDVSSSVRAMKAGALDFLEKPFEDDELLAAIGRALARDRESRAELLEQTAIRKRLETLTPRERDVMELVVEGLLNKQIAGRLGTAEGTVKIHRGRVMAKMEAHSVPELVRMAERAGVPRPPRP